MNKIFAIIFSLMFAFSAFADSGALLTLSYDVNTTSIYPKDLTTFFQGMSRANDDEYSFSDLVIFIDDIDLNDTNILNVGDIALDTITPDEGDSVNVVGSLVVDNEVSASDSYEIGNYTVSYSGTTPTNYEYSGGRNVTVTFNAIGDPSTANDGTYTKTFGWDNYGKYTGVNVTQ